MTLLRLLALLLLPLLLAGCEPTGDDDDSALGDDDDVVPDFVEATIVLAPALEGEEVEGIEVTWQDEVVAADADGRARFTLPSQTDFAIVAASAGIQTTWLEGNSGVRDFQFVTFVGPVELHDAVVAGLLLPARDPARGTLVVAMDTVALQAAWGASVEISAPSDDPFIFVNDEPVLGHTLEFQAAGFVTFPNIAPGDVTVDVTPPEGDNCLSFPGLTGPNDYLSYAVRAGAVTTAQFICQ